MPLLSFLGDALWIIALSIMAGASRDAWKRTTPQTRMPMQFRSDGTPLWRATRASALLSPPIAAFLISLVLLAYARNPAASADTALILFGVRATAAGLLPLAHLRWLRTSMKALASEGALKA
jgi:uncharacterized membrane protein HdeD (DUF308 family)